MILNLVLFLIKLKKYSCIFLSISIFLFNKFNNKINLVNCDAIDVRILINL